MYTIMNSHKNIVNTDTNIVNKKITTEERMEAVKDYLKSARLSSAIYSDKLKLVWSNDDELFAYFQELKHKLDSSVFPVMGEITVPIRVLGKTFPLTLTPYFSEKKTIFYICSVHKSNDILELFKKSEIRECVNRIINSQHAAIANIVGVAKAFERSIDNVTPDEKCYYIQKQVASSDTLISQLNTLQLLLGEDEYEEERTTSVSELYTLLTNECNAELKAIGRRISGTREGGNSFVAFSSKRLMIILMNLLQNALLYSPKGSGIEFNLRYSSDLAVITIKNEISDPNKRINPTEHSGIAIPIIKNALIEAGGNFKYSESDGMATAELVIPLVKFVNNKILTSRQREYVQGRYDLIRIFLNEALTYGES